MTKAGKIVVVISSLFFLLSCANKIDTTKTEPGNKEWLQKPVCTFPCWQNITPNETNFKNVMPILQDAKVIFRYATEDEIAFTFEENIYGSIYKASDGTVDPIVFSVHNAKLRMNDFEQIIGVPEKIHLIRDYDGRRCRATLLYPDYGTVLEVYLENKKSIISEWWECRVNLTSDSEVFLVVLVSKNFDDSEFWMRVYSNLGNPDEEWGYGYMEWKGYGKYP